MESESRLELESVGVDRFCLESELESVKFCRLRLRAGFAAYQPSTDNDFGRTVMHRSENIERQEEKESGVVEIKLNRHLMIELHLIKGNGDNFWVFAVVV